MLITTRHPMMACCVVGTMPAGHAATEPVRGDRTAAEAEVDIVRTSQQEEYDRLVREIKDFSPTAPGRERLERETLRRDALIWAEDKTPVDVILRRTRALMTAISGLAQAPDLSGERTALEALAGENRGELTEVQRKDLFMRLCALRRLIVWMDCGSLFYGAYKEAGRQARGELVLPGAGLPPNYKDFVR